MTRVLLVDDDPLVCNALEGILGSADDLEVVGSVRDGDEVVTAIHRHRPDVVLMDIQMARQDGITTTRALAEMSNPARVLILTTFEVGDVLLQAVHAGAAGFLLKSSNPQEIVEGVRRVAAGEGSLSARSAGQLVAHIQSEQAGEHRRAARGLVEQLTERELDVARCVARGLTNGEAAAELFLGEATVKSHLSRAQDKLGVRSRAQVAVLVDRAGLL